MNIMNLFPLYDQIKFSVLMSLYIKETLDKFNEPDRSIFILRFFYFEKVKSIALKLNLDEKKVENILYRSKSKLKEELIKGGIIYEEYSPNVK